MKDRTSDAEIRACKQQMRATCLRKRRALHNKATLSDRICDLLYGTREYATARTLATYVALPEEVQTQGLIHRAWNDGKEVTVPCCMEDELRLFRLKAMDDLAPRTLGILEPREHFQQQEKRWCEADEIDLFVVPGVAFDSLGGRIGHGRGYYDRLLSRSSRSALKIALAFECQLVDRVPMTTCDVSMDCVVTERCLYRHRGE